jgi:LysR family transcriptional regulator, transcriptional activator for bauABCD operon
MDAPAPKLINSITEGDLRLMRIFRVVAEARGLTAAERKLNMERSTISRHIKALEERLGGRICLRGPAGFELTELGEAALRASVMACDTLDQVRDELNLARSVITGDLMVGLPDNCLTNPNSRVVAAITAFRRQVPKVSLHISIRPPSELLANLMARHLHLCVAGKQASYEKLVFDSLFEEEFRLYVGGKAVTQPSLSDLGRQGYVLVTRKNDRRTKGLAGRLGLLELAIASGLEAVATFLASGGSVGFLPTHYASSLGQSCGLREVKDAEHLSYQAQFHLVQEQNRPQSAQGLLFSKLLIAAHRSDAAAAAE